MSINGDGNERAHHLLDSIVASYCCQPDAVWLADRRHLKAISHAAQYTPFVW